LRGVVGGLAEGKKVENGKVEGDGN
jgi:hypothetical protein